MRHMLAIVGRKQKVFSFAKLVKILRRPDA